MTAKLEPSLDSRIFYETELKQSRWNKSLRHSKEKITPVCKRTRKELKSHKEIGHVEAQNHHVSSFKLEMAKWHAKTPFRDTFSLAKMAIYKTVKWQGYMSTLLIAGQKLSLCCSLIKEIGLTDKETELACLKVLKFSLKKIY